MWYNYATQIKKAANAVTTAEIVRKLALRSMEQLKTVLLRRRAAEWHGKWISEEMPSPLLPIIFRSAVLCLMKTKNGGTFL